MPLATAFVSAYDVDSVSTLKDTLTSTEPAELHQLANRLSHRMADNDELEIWQASVSGFAQAPRTNNRHSVRVNPPATSRTNSHNALQSSLSSPRVGTSDRTRSSSNASSTPIAASEQQEMLKTLPTKKQGRFSSFFALKEPSTMAFEQMQRAAQEEMKQKRATGGTVVRATPSGKMPENVPKVNSKWDGLPEGMTPPKTANSPYDALSAIGGAIAGRPSTSFMRSDPNKQPIVAATSLDSFNSGVSSIPEEDFHFPPHPSVVVPKVAPAPVSTVPALTSTPGSPDELPQPRTPTSPAKSRISPQTGLVTLTKGREEATPWETFEPPTSPVKTAGVKAPVISARPIAKPSNKSREDVAPWDFQEPPPHVSGEHLPIRQKEVKPKTKKSGLFGRN